MRKISLLAVSFSVLALAACSENSPEITSADFSPSYVKPVPTPPAVNSNGPTWVLGAFDFAITTTVGTAAGVNAHPQGKGSCGDPTAGEDPAVWYSHGAHQATSAPFCAGSGTGISTIVLCTIDPQGLPATYAFGTGGQGAPGTGSQTKNNENLNFHSDLLILSSTQFVHYHAKKNQTTGKDETAFTFSCNDGTEGDGYIDLGALSANSNSFNWLSESSRQLDLGSGIPVRMYATGDSPNTDPPGTLVGEGNMDLLSWVYRSRVPNA